MVLGVQVEALGLALGWGSFPCDSSILLKANKCPWGYTVCLTLTAH